MGICVGSHVHACAVALIELCSIFFFWNQETPCTCCKAHRAMPPNILGTPNAFHLQCRKSYPLFSAPPHLHVLAPEEAAWLHLFRTHLSHLPRSVSLRDSIPSSLRLHQHLGHWCLVIQPVIKDLKVRELTCSSWDSGSVSNCIFQAQNRISLLLNHSRSPKVLLACANLHTSGVFLGGVQEPEHPSSHSKQFACSHPVLPGQGDAQSAQGCFLPDGLHARPSPDIFNLPA